MEPEKDEYMKQPSWINRTLSKRYTIEALLGQGGMSAVYKANDPNLKRAVAIKLIHPHLAADSKFVMRFEEEAEAVAKLRHPNIVQVFDFNSDGGVYYMVLELIPGETLQERLKRLNKAGRQMSPDEAVRFTIDICDALGYAHRQGIIHRDIKPANIMLDVHGHAILMDFGIVKIIGGDSHTATGAVVGTARYMSPETIRSEAPDQRSDIYSLGITLYEMLNGEPPFNADSAISLMMMHLNDPVPDLHSIRPGVPLEITDVLQKSLEKDPDCRYNTIGEMAADLRRVLARLEKRSVATEQTLPESPQYKIHVSEMQVDTEDPEKNPDRNFADQMGSYAPATSPKEVRRATIKENVAVSAKSQGTSTSAHQMPMSADRNHPLQTHDRPALKKSWLPLLLGLGTGGIVLMIILAAGIFFLGKILSANIATAVSNMPNEGQAVTLTVALPQDLPTTTDTMPSLYVRINDITTNASYQYVVKYETFGFIETLPGMHVHFFFDTVTPENAGPPGEGPWKMYGGPSPFTGYSEFDRPGSASQMCVLVVNADHSVILGSGNCLDLP
jgi:serine/threonine protein kinase